MSRKHYRQAAEILAERYQVINSGYAYRNEETAAVARYELNMVTRGLADMFSRDNGAFDRQRFYEAAGSWLIA